MATSCSIAPPVQVDHHAAVVRPAVLIGGVIVVDARAAPAQQAAGRSLRADVAELPEEAPEAPARADYSNRGQTRVAGQPAGNQLAFWPDHSGESPRLALRPTGQGRDRRPFWQEAGAAGFNSPQLAHHAVDDAARQPGR